MTDWSTNRFGVRLTPKPKELNQNYIRKQAKNWRLKRIQPIFEKVKTLEPGETLQFQSPNFTIISYIRKHLYRYLNKKGIKQHFEIKQPSANELVVLRQRAVKISDERR